MVWGYTAGGPGVPDVVGQLPEILAEGEAKDPFFMDNKYWGINDIKKIRV